MCAAQQWLCVACIAGNCCVLCGHCTTKITLVTAVSPLVAHRIALHCNICCCLQVLLQLFFECLQAPHLIFIEEDLQVRVWGLHVCVCACLSCLLGSVLCCAVLPLECWHIVFEKRTADTPAFACPFLLLSRDDTVVLTPACVLSLHTRAMQQVAPDFFSYMEATAPLLDADPSLWCISAWNDHGQQGRASNVSALYRTDGEWPRVGRMQQLIKWWCLATTAVQA